MRTTYSMVTKPIQVPPRRVPPRKVAPSWAQLQALADAARTVGGARAIAT
jgi:hypothetical protein